jgi:hypothetical protein
MKTITIIIEKKNRKYFAAKVNGYKCKLLIDENSEGLELGTHELLVNDISVRSKYGTDLIYSVYKKTEDGGIVTSGGSAKNWTTVVSEESVFRLKVPKLVLEECREKEESKWSIQGGIND